MFGLFSDVVETGLDALEGLAYGELPSKRQVARLVDAGLTVYAISQFLGVSEEVICEMIDE